MRMCPEHSRVVHRANKWKTEKWFVLVYSQHLAEKIMRFLRFLISYGEEGQDERCLWNLGSRFQFSCQAIKNCDVFTAHFLDVLWSVMSSSYEQLQAGSALHRSVCSLLGTRSFFRVLFFCLHSFPNTLIHSHDVIKLCFSSWHWGHQQAVKYRTALLHLMCFPLGAVHPEIINTAQILKLTGGKKGEECTPWIRYMAVFISQK